MFDLILQFLQYYHSYLMFDAKVATIMLATNGELNKNYLPILVNLPWFLGAIGLSLIMTTKCAQKCAQLVYVASYYCMYYVAWANIILIVVTCIVVDLKWN